MTYQRESVVQPYGDLKFLAYKITGNIESQPLNHVGDRVPSYGIINFGAMKAKSKKQIKPIDMGIEQDILLRSLYAFTNHATSEEVTIRLFLGNTEVLEQKLTNAEMPYTFPPGAILNPNLTIEVQPQYNTVQLLLYWQPVHVLSYLEID